MHYGLMDMTEMAAMSGLEFFEGMVAGRHPHPKMARLMGMRMVHAEYGLVRWEARVPEDAFNPMGTTHGGFALTVLDSALACSVHACVAKGQSATTIDVKANLTRPVPPGETLTCEGRMVTLGRRIGTSEAKLIDSRDRVIAFGTSSMMILDL